MDHQDSNTLAEPVAAADVAHVKLEVEDMKPEADLALDKTDVPSFDDFKVLLNSLPSSAAAPISDAYGRLLSLYQHKVGRLRLLELIGANGILTDALVLRLQLLNEENERLLFSERANRAGLKEFEQRLEDQRKQTEEAEAALHDALQLLQQQVDELAGQTKLISDFQEKLHADRSSHSRRTSDKSESRPSHRSSRDEGKGDRDRDRDRNRDHRSHRSESSRHRERESHRHERESSITSSRRSSSRRDDVGPSKSDREPPRVDRIREDEEDQDPPIDEDSYARGHSHKEWYYAENSVSERRISFNGAASKDANGHNGGTFNQCASNPVKEAAQEEEEYEPEIDIGEDLVFEEEEAPVVKPAPVPTSTSRRRSRSRSPQRHGHRESDHRVSHRTRSRSPSRRDRSSDEHSSKEHTRDDGDRESMERLSRTKLDDPSSRIKTEDREATRSRRREVSSNNSSRNRNNMFGRLGLPISNNANSEGGKAQFSIRGAGRKQ